jgi:CheY-like chemotaxis protein
VEEQNGAVVTCVADTGGGIPAKDLTSIFEKFYRVNNAHTRQASGTGLGLAITRVLVNRLGGTIWVESEPGKGSQFWFTLPLALPDDAPARSPVPVLQGAPRLGLSVASDTALLHRLTHALKQHGWTPTASNSVAEAVRRARSLRPDAILLDPFASKIDATSLLQQLQDDPSTWRLTVRLLLSSCDTSDAQALDTLLLAPTPKTSPRSEEQFAQVLQQALANAIHPERGVLVVALGSESFAHALKTALGTAYRFGIIAATDPAVADKKLGARCPHLLVAETHSLSGESIGAFLHQIQERYPTVRIPIVLVGEPCWVREGVTPLVPFGQGAVPIAQIPTLLP